jgi:thioredoxin-related protein
MAHVCQWILHTILAVSALPVWADLIAGDKLPWRTDYNAGRREAKEKDRPIVLYFHTDPCKWCEKLETETFRDPAVVKLLRKRFILIIVDAEKEPQLVQYLRIAAFPTLVLAKPDGKILGTVEGYQEPAKFKKYLERALGFNKQLEQALDPPPRPPAPVEVHVVEGVPIVTQEDRGAQAAESVGRNCSTV